MKKIVNSFLRTKMAYVVRPMCLLRKSEEYLFTKMNSENNDFWFAEKLVTAQSAFLTLLYILLLPIHSLQLDWSYNFQCCNVNIWPLLYFQNETIHSKNKYTSHVYRRPTLTGSSHLLVQFYNHLKLDSFIQIIQP